MNDWMKDAACSDAPLDMFFTHDKQEQKLAIEVYCDNCPVRDECLETFGKQQFGIFGGMTEAQRQVYRRRQRARRAA